MAGNGNGGMERRLSVILEGISQQLTDTQEEILALKVQVKDINNSSIESRKKLIRHRKAQQLALDASARNRMEERLMLNVPEQQRAEAMHQKWLEKNSQDLWESDQEMDRLEKLVKNWISNNG